MRAAWCCAPEVCKGHVTGAGHPERPERIGAIVDAFAAADLEPPRISPGIASREDILRVHTAQHYDTIQATCGDGRAYPDVDTVMGPGSWEAATQAAGAAIACCRAVVEGTHARAFSTMRPPGHHAEADHAMGFCLFNNVAVAARWLQAEAGVGRVAILDWDVHHGNGTQHSFYEDDTVFYASIHQFPHYPGTGRPQETGKNNTNLNVTMTAGMGESEWLEALSKKVLPALAGFDPEFLLISCGFDAHRLDPLGSQRLESTTFAKMTRLVLPVADGKIVSLLEGGYHLTALGESSVAHFRALGAEA